MSRHFLLQGIFSTQGLNPCLLHCRKILYCLSQQGRPSFLIIYFWLYWVFVAVWAASPLVVESGGYSQVAGGEFFAVVASFVAEHGL